MAVYQSAALAEKPVDMSAGEHLTVTHAVQLAFGKQDGIRIGQQHPHAAFHRCKHRHQAMQLTAAQLDIGLYHLLLYAAVRTVSEQSPEDGIPPEGIAQQKRCAQIGHRRLPHGIFQCLRQSGKEPCVNSIAALAYVSQDKCDNIAKAAVAALAVQTRKQLLALRELSVAVGISLHRKRWLQKLAPPGSE